MKNFAGELGVTEDEGIKWEKRERMPRKNGPVREFMKCFPKTSPIC